ncbi:MAG: glycosyl hydrolase family 28 protein [Phycisphaerae bacterium]
MTDRKTHPVMAAMAAVFLLLVPAVLASADGGSVTPYKTEVGKPCDVYKVTADGKDVEVKNFWKNRRMARLGFDGEVTVSISAKGKPVKAYSIRPWWVEHKAEVEGETLKITLKKPADLRVVVNDNPALALFTYPTYKKPSGKDVHSLADEKGADATGKTDQTAVLQAAIDRIHKDGGGTLYVPPGVYGGSKQGELFFKSNVALNLHPEATIRQIRFLLNDVENVKLVGHGVLDFTGSPRGNQAGCLRGNDANNVRIEHLTSLNFDYNWNTRFDRSRNVLIQHYRVFGGKDGINPVDSQKITIRHVYIVTMDDCIASKSFSQGRRKKTEAVSDILAEYGMLQCIKYGALKIGTETNANHFRNITYRNMDIVSAMRVAIIQLRDGAEVSNITFENITCDYAFGRAIDFVIQKRKGLGTIHDVLVKNVNLKKITRKEGKTPRVAGFDDAHKSSNVTFENLVVEGKQITKPEQADFELKHAENIRFVTTPQQDDQEK